MGLNAYDTFFNFNELSYNLRGTRVNLSLSKFSLNWMNNSYSLLLKSGTLFNPS